MVPFIVWGALVFVTAARHLALPLMEIIILVSVVLGWDFQSHLSPFSLFGWGVTYNDLLMALCMVNWALLVFSGRKVWPEKRLVKALSLFWMYMMTIPIIYTLILNPGDMQWIPSEMGYLFYYLLIFPFCHAVEKKGAMDQLLKVLFFAIIGATVVTVLYHQGILYIPAYLGRGFGGGRVHETSPAVMLVGFFVAIALLTFGKRKVPMRLFALLTLASSAVLMLLSQARSFLIAVPAGLVTFFFVVRLRYKIEGSNRSLGGALLRWLVWLLAVGVIILGVSALFPEARDEFLDRWDQLSELGHISVESRKTDVTILLPYALAGNPITGLGAGRSYVEMKLEYGLGSSRGAHSVWVYLFVKAGVFGVLLFLNYQYVVLRAAYTIWTDKSRDPLSVAWAAAIFISNVSVLVLSSIFTVACLSESMTIIYCLFFAVLNSFLRQGRPEVS